MTLKALFTKTTVHFREELDRDMLMLNGVRAPEKQERRAGAFLNLFRERAGISAGAEIISENNFPTGAGLASSASGFSALALAAERAANLELSPAERTAVARQGSGSAARSVFGGFVEMQPGENPDGSDAVAVRLYDEDYWPLEMLICITSEAAKPIGSTEGMVRTAETSPFYRDWVSSSRADIAEMRRALAEKDFEKVGDIAEYSCFKMHGLALSARPAILYWNELTVTLIHEIRNLRKQGISAYVTIDAGPQIKVLCLPESTDAVMNHLQNIDGIKQILKTTIGPGAHIIEEA